MTRLPIPLAAPLALALALACPAAAQQTAFGGIRADTKAPVEVTADALGVSQKDGQAVFTGNVVISQGAMRLGAEKVMRVLPPPDGRMSVISALRWFILSTTVPENSSSTSITTVSYGSVFLPLSSSPNSTRGRLMPSSNPSRRIVSISTPS